MAHVLLRTVITAAALLPACIASGAAAHEARPSAAASRVHWQSNVEDALREARASHKLVFVDFYAAWCGPCQRMLRTTYKDPGVISKLNALQPVLVDVDKQPQVAAKYAVEAIPVTLVLDERGAVISRSVGYEKPGDLLAAVSRAQKIRRPRG